MIGVAGVARLRSNLAASLLLELKFNINIKCYETPETLQQA